MSLTDNFSQALKEILKKDVINDGKDKKAAQKTELDRYIEPVAPPVTENVAPAEEKPVQEAATVDTSDSSNYYEEIVRETQAAKQQRAQQEMYSQPNAEEVKSEDAAPATSPSIFESAGYNESDTQEQTVISKNTVIEGNIRSFANVTIDGNVKGDVQLTKNACVSGKVIGNVECNNAVMSGSQMQGNINSKGQARFDKDSLIIGDIAASYLDMNGKVKGNIEVAGKADFKSDAYILGDITVSTLTVLEGATISGHVNTTFIQEPASNIFPESISMSELG